MAIGVRPPGDGDLEGSALVHAADDESEAPFAVHDEGAATVGFGSRLRGLGTALHLGRPTVAGVGVGAMVFVAIIGLISLGGDDSPLAAPTAGAAGSDGGGSRGAFTDGGLFASEAPKKRSRAAGAAGKAAALAQARSGGDQALGQPAGPNTGAGLAGQNPFDSPDRRSGIGGPLDAGATAAGGDGDPGTGRGVPGGAATPGGIGAPDPGGSGGGTGDLRPGSDPATRQPPTGPGDSFVTSPTTRPTIPTAPTTSKPINPVTTNGRTTTRPTTSVSTITSNTTTTTTTATTQPPDTDPPVDNTPLIAAPANGSSYAPNARITFTANPVSGASEYCWTFSGPGVGPFTRCTGGTTYTLALGGHGFGPGTLSVNGVARSGSATLKSGSLSLTLVLDSVMVQPKNGSSATIGKNLRIGFRGVPGATRYCYRLRQGGYDSGEICLSGNGVTIKRNDPLWDRLGPGSLRIDGRVFIGSTVAGADTVTITLTN